MTQTLKLKAAAELAVEQLEIRRLMSTGVSPLASEIAGSIVARPAGNTGTGFFVASGKVYDANGHQFVIKGFNQTAQYGDTTKNLDAINEVAKTGANAVRAVFGTFGAGGTPAGRQSVVAQYLAEGIVPIVEDASATNSQSPADLQAITDRWLLPANVSWLKADEKNVILNIANEWGPDSSAYRDAYISQIDRLRAAGVNAMIMIDAGGSGQSADSLEQFGKAVLDADPQHNVVFSVHMYDFYRTGTTTGLNTAPSGTFKGSPWDVQTELAKLQSLGLPVVVGEYSMTDGTGGNVPYDTRSAMQAFANLGVGSLAWSWNQNGNHTHDMLAATAGWQYNSDSDLSAFGNLVINDPALGLKATAVPASSLRPATIAGTLLAVDGSGDAGATVFIDDNTNGVLDAGELSATTAADGTFSFTNLPQGVEHLRTVATDDAPLGASPVTIALPAGASVQTSMTVISNATPSKGSISGVVFNDANQDGFRAPAEAGLAGQQVFIDSNGNGAFDAGETSTTTGSTGAYTFGGLAAGAYTVGMVLPGGFVQTTRTLPVTLGKREQVAELMLGATQPAALGSISGVMFNDANGDGVQDNGETVEASKGLYLDLNNNGKQDAGEPSTNTYTDGTYLFTRVPPGTYTVAKTADGTKVTTAAVTATVAAFQNTAAAPTGVQELPGSISGIVYTDTNGNGLRDTGEPVAAGITVYMDTNGDRTLSAGELSTVTDASGAFSFTNLPTGAYAVRAVPPAGQTQTNGTQFYNLTSSVNYTLIKIGVGVAAAPVVTAPVTTGVISGVYYQDTNQNNVDDAGEAPVAGAVVYLDTNNNGVLDAGETSATSGSDGTFIFTGLAAGTYHLRSAQPKGYTITSPASDVFLSAGQDFSSAQFAVIPVSPPPAVVSYEAELASLTGGTFKATNHANYTGTGFADYGGNGSAVTFTVWRSDVGNATLGFRYANGSTTARPFTIIVNGVTVGTLAGTYTGSWDKWVNATVDVALVNGNNTISAVAGPATGANLDSLTITSDLGNISGTAFNDLDGDGAFDNADTVSAAQTIFLDTNNNGVLDAGEPSTVTGQNGVYGFTGVAAGTYHVREVLAANYTATTSPIDIALTGGQLATGLNLGSKLLTSSLSGVAFTDADGDGQLDNADTKKSSQIVYLDTNNNGVLDAGETSVTTSADGSFTFTALPAGLYHVREVVAAGDATTTAPIDITLAAGQNVTGLAIGSERVQGSISGTAFVDADGDGMLDNADTVAAGQTVYLDANNNGTLDAGEISTTTAADGTFAFTGLTTGTYHVREIVGPKDAVTTAPIDINLGVGQDVAGLAVGSERVQGSISGKAFVDADGDGAFDNADTVAAGQTVYLDTNNNGTLDAGEVSTTTAADGTFAFSGVLAGTYHVREVAGPKDAVTTAPIDITLAAGQDLAGLAIGTERVRGSISGTAFTDANGNGTFDSTETAAANQTVYLDANNNGTLDASEVSTTTAADGTFTFTGLPAGVYHVREVVPTGYTATTTPADVTLTAGQDAAGITLGTEVTPVVTPPVVTPPVVTPPVVTPPVVTPTVQVIQSEDALLTGGTYRQTNHAGYTGTGFADYGGDGSAVTYTITQATAGAATLTFRYANGDKIDRPLTIIVSGVTVATMSFLPTGSWDKWANASINLTLAAGTNTVKAICGPATGANYDTLTITTPAIAA